MPNIKEIALKIADSLRNKIDGISHMQSNQGLVRFTEALISAYKAELLKEVSDPIAYYDPDLDCGSAGISFDPLSDGIGLYTSDQLAAAVARATKPLEDSLAVVKKDRADLYMETLTLRDQLAKTEQLWQVAQGRCDGLEEKLAKAEQRVAEAIVDMLQQKHRNCFGAHSFYLAASVATANGEWRKFVKEV